MSLDLYAEICKWAVVRDRCARPEQALGRNDCNSRGGCKIVAQRYCTNCGAEPGDEVRLCPSCRRAVRETGAVSTPETDVSVSPVPQASEDTSGHAARTEEEHRSRISLGKFLGGFLVLVVVLWLLIPTEVGSDGV
jgi:hypothetical protein